MTDIIILTIIGAVLAWAMLPPAIHPDVARRLRSSVPSRRRPTMTLPARSR